MSWNPDRDQMLERVYAHVGRIRARRRRLVAAGTAAVTLVAGIGVWALAGPAATPVNVFTDPVATAETTASPPPIDASPEPASAPEPTTTPGTPSPDPSAAPVCKNSYDAACGPFSWEPAPDENEPMDVDVEFTPSDPEPGDTVTFMIQVTDDSSTKPRVSQIAWGDGEATTSQFGCQLQQERYGPWSPPQPMKKTRSVQVTHSYGETGTYEIEIDVSTDGCDFFGYNPFGDRETVRKKIVVR